jgi:hypothetical protein
MIIRSRGLNSRSMAPGFSQIFFHSRSMAPGFYELFFPSRSMACMLNKPNFSLLTIEHLLHPDSREERNII